MTVETPIPPHAPPHAPLAPPNVAHENLALAEQSAEQSQGFQQLKASFDKPCATCETPDADLLPLTRVLKTGFYNGLEVCFSDLAKDPKRILVIGGCRQWAMARRLGFLIPHSKIWVLDPNEAIVRHADEVIHCRFEFTHSMLTELPFEDHSMDLVLALNCGELWAEQEQLFTTEQGASQEALPSFIGELDRVTRHHLIVGSYQPQAVQWAKMIPGVTQPLIQLHQELGCLMGAPAFPKTGTSLLQQRLGNPDVTVWPLPWKLERYTRQA